MRLMAGLGLVLLLLPAASGRGQGGGPVDYNRNVRPILSNNCFKCHGPDAAERQAGLRLDGRDTALKPLKSGRVAIVPGKPEESALVGRIFAADPDEVMPPPGSQKRLTQGEKEVLRQWIAEGAPYQRHWAFVPPEVPELPRVRGSDWVRNEIDSFVLARLEAEGLSPSPEAEKTTLIRRLAFDLTGLPPPPAEVDAFLADGSPDAFERLVERLLASPRHGERLAVDWLDAARYADTHGYHIDSGRDMTRWREWVIEAFNGNLPFDRFTVEQIAGDLLPEATLETRIASGFHRNHMINFEGGAIPEEYQTAYIVDRVNTTGAVWLGLTVGCGQCHDHKYDPLTQKEFYQLFAFFHNVPENGLDGAKGNAVPFIKLPTAVEERSIAGIELELKRLEGQPAPAGGSGESKPGSEAQALKAPIDKLKARKAEIEKRIRTSMVMQEMEKPRDTFLLIRGQYDKRGDRVTAGVPAFLHPLPEGAPLNRLGLASWLVSRANPLTPRVIVNRFWQMVFGTGLVKTAEDFGSQGEPPSHPELLDDLARRFADSGWNVKGLLRLLVTSATYRQSAAVTSAAFERDPENRLLARGPRFRLPAEAIRDQALEVSGLLDGRIGGASVSPYQPAGLWEELMSREDGANWSAQTYVQSHGQDLYRRTLYTFWKRTSPPPTLSTFDAPDRETCTVRRARTNTPLQALILMNDPTYVEAARKLAERLLREAGDGPDGRIRLAFRLLTARLPTGSEAAVLRELFETERAAFARHPDSALKLLGAGEAPRDERLDPAELAAWTVVASALLNLDETVTKG